MNLRYLSSEFRLEQDISGEWCAYPNSKGVPHA